MVLRNVSVLPDVTASNPQNGEAVRARRASPRSASSARRRWKNRCVFDVTNESWILISNEYFYSSSARLIAAARVPRHAPPAYDCIQGNDAGTVLIRGGSVIVSPLGDVLAGPLYGEKGLLACAGGKSRAVFAIVLIATCTRPIRAKA
ncbi:MAG: hypothetical protein ACRDH2_12965 [Anaerolineales bacterium]